MGRDLYRVYVDEAGDRGWSSGSSPCFILTGVVVRDSGERAVRNMLDGINARLYRAAGAELHWAKNLKPHAVRKFVSQLVAFSDSWIVAVVVTKQAYRSRQVHLQDPGVLYQYTVR